MHRISKNMEKMGRKEREKSEEENVVEVKRCEEEIKVETSGRC